MGFRYQERSSEDVASRAKGGNNSDSFIRSELKTWTPAEGDNKIRILPPTWEDARHFGFDCYVNYRVGPDNASFVCPEKMFGEFSPIADAKREAERQGDTEFAKKLNPSHRVLVWIIDRNKEEDGPMVWAMPQSFDRDLAGRCTDKDTGEVLLIDHPDEGFDVTFTRKGKMRNTEYLSIEVGRRPSKLSNNSRKSEEWLDFISENPLPECVTHPTAEAIERAFNGGASIRTQMEKDAKGEGDDRGGRAGARDSKSKKPDYDDDIPQNFGDPGTRGRSRQPEMTWAELSAKSMDQLDAFCEEKNIDLFADDYTNEADFALAIAENQGIPVESDKGEEGRSSLRRRRQSA